MKSRARRPTAPANADAGIAARDRFGDIRLNNGRGTLVALKNHSHDQIDEWFRTSRPGQYREQYRAALALITQENAAAKARLAADSATS